MNFLESIKAYGQKIRKFIITPKMTLHSHEGHSMIDSFGIRLMRESWIRCICLEPQGHGFKPFVALKISRFFVNDRSFYCKWSNFYLISFVKPNISFWFYLTI
jgi:hypothetical protein